MKEVSKKVLYCILEGKKHKFFEFSYNTKYALVADRVIVNKFMFDLGLI